MGPGKSLSLSLSLSCPVVRSCLMVGTPWFGLGDTDSTDTTDTTTCESSALLHPLAWLGRGVVEQLGVLNLTADAVYYAGLRIRCRWSVLATPQCGLVPESLYAQRLELATLKSSVSWWSIKGPDCKDRLRGKLSKAGAGHAALRALSAII